jgi:hypothetical protein
MIINFGAKEMRENINNGVFANMNRVRAVELSLIAQRAYDPGDYIAEIKEIYRCITESKEYDDAPELSKSQLTKILENLTADSRHPGKYSIRQILIEGEKTKSLRERKKYLERIQDILFT